MSSVKAQFDKDYNGGGFPPELLDKYACVESLSKSELGQTFLFDDKQSRERVVVKAYPKTPDASAPDSALEGVVHPGLPKLLGRFEDANYSYVVRSFIPGTPLSELALNGTLAPARVISFGCKLCDILSFIHGLNPPVIHRDVKPENVILGADGNLTLIDFGIARRFDSAVRKDTTLLGTPDYAPPEQYGFQQTDARTDIYALGVTLLFLLTGSSDMPMALDLLDNSQLSGVIRRSTAFSPKDRYADAGQVKRALENATPVARRKRRVLAACCLAAIVALSSGAGLWIGRATAPKYVIGGDIAQTDQVLIDEAAAYMNEKYNTTLFETNGLAARMGYLKSLLINVYGLDRDYVYADPPTDPPYPHESEQSFFPYSEMEDEQFLFRDEALGFCVKIYWPAYVADWSFLEGMEDTGFYPGGIAARALSDKFGVVDEIYHVSRISKGDLSLILYRLDRLFDELGPDISYKGLGL